MKQELEAILSFGAQAVSGAKTVFDEAASRSLDRLIQGNSGYKEISSNPAELTQTLREATMQNGQSPLAVVVCCTPASGSCSSSATPATSSANSLWAARSTPWNIWGPPWSS